MLAFTAFDRTSCHACNSSWRTFSACLQGFIQNGKYHKGVKIFVIGPAGEICSRRFAASIVFFSLTLGSSQARVHIILEAISSMRAWISSGVSRSLNRNLFTSKSIIPLYSDLDEL